MIVTGGAGFIGSHVVDSLLARDADVVAIDSFDPYYDPRIKWDNIVTARRNPRFQLIESDIRDVDILDSALGEAPYDAIVHLAAAVGVRPSIADPDRYVRMNVEGTAAALKLAERRGIGLFLLGAGWTFLSRPEAGATTAGRIPAPQAGFLALDPRSGQIKAWVGSRDFAVYEILFKTRCRFAV